MGIGYGHSREPTGDHTMRGKIASAALCLTMSLAMAAAPPHNNERHLPKEAKYLLDLHESHALAEIRLCELILATESRARVFEIARKDLRLFRRKLYMERIDLIDKILHDPQRWIYQDLSLPGRRPPFANCSKSCATN
jgi:hypothetical protein